MHIPADEWQSKMEASVKEVQKLEDHYTVKCQNLGVSMLCFYPKISPTFFSIISITRQRKSRSSICCLWTRIAYEQAHRFMWSYLCQLLTVYQL
jgi:hypothetical protein